MNKTIHNQVIALAGLSQAVYLVQQIAKRGIADSSAMESSIASVLKIDADSPEDVYGGLEGVKVGLQKLKQQLGGRDTIDPEQARYAASLVFLERKLSKQRKMLQDIRLGIERAAAQAEYFSMLHENVLATLADTYLSTISTLQPRVMIARDKEQDYLSNPGNVNKIRALLLAGIRSVVLWRQCGGTRWKFLLYRNRVREEMQRLLKSL